MNTIVEACDKIADTATAHDRTFIVEVMGRDCGYLAMTSAIAVGADLALFPEAGKPEADDRRADRRRRCSTVRKRPSRRAPPRDHHQGRGRRRSQADRLKALVDARLQRARARRRARARSRPASPCSATSCAAAGRRAFDRLLGSRLANVAVRALLAGETHKMAAWMPPVELPEEVGTRSPYDPYCWLVDLGAVLAETENLSAGPEPAGALARRRVRRDRGRAAVIVWRRCRCRPIPSCTCSSIARRSACTARRADGRFTYVNPALARMLGYARRGAARARTSTATSTPIRRARARCIEKFPPGASIDGAEVEWQHKDGRTDHVQLWGHADRRPRDGTRRSTPRCIDVTDAKRAASARPRAHRDDPRPRRQADAGDVLGRRPRPPDPAHRRRDPGGPRLSRASRFLGTTLHDRSTATSRARSIRSRMHQRALAGETVALRHRVSRQAARRTRSRPYRAATARSSARSARRSTSPRRARSSAAWSTRSAPRASACSPAASRTTSTTCSSRCSATPTSRCARSAARRRRAAAPSRTSATPACAPPSSTHQLLAYAGPRRRRHDAGVARPRSSTSCCGSPRRRCRANDHDRPSTIPAELVAARRSRRRSARCC